jgi:2-polyprenyl-6-methoxyphenol hydroxylase-like FAD-dependent oxidoreductase
MEAEPKNTTEQLRPGSKFEVAIVGAGIAGGVLATALARRGISVLLLEKTLCHQDRVRGECMVPWGVQEAIKLGIIDALMAAGGHFIRVGIPYGEGIDFDAARSRAVNMRTLLPEVDGQLAFSHPRACQALNDAAQAAGATLLRGVGNIAIALGIPPRLTFKADGKDWEVVPRLVVGADGRGSAVARQIGARIELARTHHLMSGLLIEDCPTWPDHEFAIGTEGNVNFFLFPQGAGRIRLYLCHGLDQPHRFSGAGNARRFLDAFRLSSLPHSERVATATAAGPCRGFANADSWIDSPIAPGVVLIGDAAGHNDPIIGQGLAISLRDARLVCETLLNNTEWNSGVFAPYVDERRERMRRLRLAGQQYSILRAEFTEEARARRRRAGERIAADPEIGLPLTTVFKGPYGLPDNMYRQAAWDRLLN